MAVEDIDSAPPMTIDTSHESPSNRPTPTNSPVVSSTCARPRPNTSRRMATMRGHENSSPSVNSRNTTPISASSCVRLESSSMPST